MHYMFICFTVSVHRNTIHDPWDYDFIRIGLFVDGHDVQYWKRLDFTDVNIKQANVLHGKLHLISHNIVV